MSYPKKEEALKGKKDASILRIELDTKKRSRYDGGRKNCRGRL